MFDSLNAKVVKRGICFYDNSVEYEVIIVESNTLYGSGDYEDPPEIAEDKEVTCYYSWFDSPANRGAFCSGSGGYFSVAEAMVDVESLVSVRWKD